jgi:calcium-dependent protein kinase
MPPKFRQTKTLNFTHDFARDNPGKIDDFYETGSAKLGEGSYGQVSRAKNKVTGKPVAVKAIGIASIPDSNRFEAEVSIQKKLDHPNIVKLYEVFKDVKKVYLVMEICEGGELFDRIVDATEECGDGHAFTECDAARYMRQIMRAMYYLHSHQFAHRDIKPENFLLQDRKKDAEIKVIDFGLAKHFEPGVDMKTKAGTPYYVAPEVLKGKYREKCDIWSCGVILYILICGYPPFYGDDDSIILKSVKGGKFDFPSPDWDDTSAEVRGLITEMLTMDQEKRPDATAVLASPWFEIISGDKSASKKLPPDFGKRFKNFRQDARLKKIALTMIATNMSNDQVEDLKATFEKLDANNDGTLTIQEITDGMRQHNLEVSIDVEEAIKKIDTDGSGSIDYVEFLAATMNMKDYFKKDILWQAFRQFDTNDDGCITKDELAAVLSKQTVADPSIAAKMIAEVDVDGDGKLSFDEFCEMMNDSKIAGAIPK